MKRAARLTRLRRSRAIVAPPQIVVVRHFDEELKRLVPLKCVKRRQQSAGQTCSRGLIRFCWPAAPLMPAERAIATPVRAIAATIAKTRKDRNTAPSFRRVWPVGALVAPPRGELDVIIP